MAKLGINVLKENLTIIAGIVKVIDEAMSDKKFNVVEGVKVALKSVNLIKVAKTIKEAKAEFLDLDGAERAELTAHFEKEFTLTNKDAELMLENLIGIAIGLSDNLKLLEKSKQE